jgi:hypothetical protein
MYPIASDKPEDVGFRNDADELALMIEDREAADPEFEH